MKIRNDFALKLNKEKKYNPNKFACFDAGIAFLAFTLFFYGASWGFVGLIRISGSVLEFMRRNYWFYYCLATVYSQGLIFLFAFVYSKIRRVGLLSGGGYAFRFNTVQALMGILLVSGIYFVFSSVHTQVSGDFSALFPSSGISLDDYPVNGWTVLDTFVLSVVLPAVCEEALMRGVVMRSLERFGSLFAIICSGAMFAIFHGNTSQLVLQFLGGVAIALTLISTRNFFVSCVTHGAYNLFVYALAVLEALLEKNHYKAYLFYDAITVFVGMCFITVALIYFVKLYRAKENRMIKNNRDIPLKRKVFLYDNDKTVRELYAYKTEEINRELENGNLFLYGKNFVSANKKGNKLFGSIFLACSIVVGIAFIFI